MRRLCPLAALLLAALLMVVFDSPAYAQWAPGGTLISGESGAPGALVRPDGAGGALVVWPGTHYPDELFLNIRFMRVNALGVLDPSYPANGRKASTVAADQYLTDVLSDGLGGWFFIWVDLRDAGQLGYDLYAQHVLPDGTVDPQWPANGAPVSKSAGDQWMARGIVDGNGGLLIVWEDDRANLTDVYANKLDASGQVEPGWPANGQPLVGPVVTRYFSGAAGPDGAGGGMVQWSEPAGGPHLLRVDYDGNPWPGWPASGLRVSTVRGSRWATPDGFGGAFMELGTGDPATGLDSSYYLQHVLPDGTLDPAWGSDGNPVCTAPVYRYNFRVFPDGLGGALMDWEDYRNGYAQVFVSRMLASGALAPGWPVNGAQLSTLYAIQTVGWLVADGVGGAYVTFANQSYGIAGHIQHLNNRGAPAMGWTSDGLALGPGAGDQPFVTTDGAGGAIAAWAQVNTDLVYAQRYISDGVVATQLSLASSEASTDHVTLVWQGIGAGDLSARVERRIVNEPWQSLGLAQRDAPDRLRWEDHDVMPGTRYGYRLAFIEDGAEHYTSETLVEVPRAATFALDGLRPNPAVDAIRVSFSLPGPGVTKLELVDLAGRRVRSKDATGLGAGRHLLAMDQGAPLEPGIYWVRLTHDDRTLTAKAMVLR